MNEESRPEAVEETPAPQMQVMAVISLVLGVLGLPPVFLVVCAPVGTVIGIGAAVCGHIALSRIRAEPGRWEGRGLAIAGAVLGYASVVLSIVVFLLFLFVFSTRGVRYPTETMVR